jgi:MFS family permease
MVLRKVGTRYWLGGIVIAFGILTIGQGFTKHWWQFAICRVLLGVFESEPRGTDRPNLRWLLPRLRLPALVLVPEIPDRWSNGRVLPHLDGHLWILQHYRLRHVPARAPWRSVGLAME